MAIWSELIFLKMKILYAVNGGKRKHLDTDKEQ